MQIEVRVVGDQVVAYSITGERITDRRVLEYISFYPMQGSKSVFTVDIPVELGQEPAGTNNIKININTQTT